MTETVGAIIVVSFVLEIEEVGEGATREVNTVAACEGGGGRSVGRSGRR